MWLAEVLIIGYNARLEILIPFPSIHPLGFSDMSVLKKSKTQLITADFVCVPLCPGHHKQTETAAQRQAQDQRQSRAADSEERGQAHDEEEGQKLSADQCLLDESGLSFESKE